MLKKLNAIAYALLFLLVVSVAPFVLPRVFGYMPYEVISDSMEPDYPVGSLIYVKKTEPTLVKKGEVITFQMDVKSRQIATHRVIANLVDEQQFITKGDHNATQDASPINYQRLIGKVTLCIPMVGAFYAWLVSTTGIAVQSFLLGMVIIIWVIVYLKKVK